MHSCATILVILEAITWFDKYIDKRLKPKIWFIRGGLMLFWFYAFTQAPQKESIRALAVPNMLGMAWYLLMAILGFVMTMMDIESGGVVVVGCGTFGLGVT